MAGPLCRRCGGREATVHEGFVRMFGPGAAEGAETYEPARAPAEPGPTLCEPCAAEEFDARLGPGAYAGILEASRRFEEFRASLAGLPEAEQRRRIREYVRRDMERAHRGRTA